MERPTNAIYFPAVALLSFLWQWWSKSSRGKETAREKRDEEEEEEEGTAVVCLLVCVCVLPKYSASTDLELAAGSHKHWFTHTPFVLFVDAVDSLSFSPSLSVELNINALYLLIMCLFFLVWRPD